MTESEARAAKISEVWAELKSADENYPRTKHILDRLRAVLLERCMEEGELPCDLIFSFTERGFVLMYMHDRKWIADADDFTELAAAAAFMAWELKQRNSESNG